MAAFTVSGIGTWAYNVALAVWIYDATGSVGWIAAATVCRFVPGAASSAPTPACSPTASRRPRLMRTVGPGVRGRHGGDGRADDGSTRPVAAVLATAAISSTLGTLYEPAAAALTPLLVPERDLASANALRNTIDNVTVIAGPALGALLLLAGPPEVAVWVNAGDLRGLGAARRGRTQTRSKAVDVTEGGEAGAVQQMLVGIRAIGSSAPDAVMVGYSVLATLVFGIDTVLFVSVSDQILGTGPDGYGYLLAGLGRRRDPRRAAGHPGRGACRAGPDHPRPGWPATACRPSSCWSPPQPEVAFGAQVVRGAGTLFVDVLAVTAAATHAAQRCPGAGLRRVRRPCACRRSWSARP